MGLRLKNKAVLIGVMAVVILVLAVFLVPTIAAQIVITDVGNVDNIETGNLETCWMIDPTFEGSTDTIEMLEASSVHIVDSNNADYPNANALMRCETQINGYDGPAHQILGKDWPQKCVIQMPVDPDVDNTNTSYFARITGGNWNQTVSASGNVVLSCHFKK